MRDIQSFREQLSVYLKAGYTGLYVVSSESRRAVEEIRAVAEERDRVMWVWELDEGWKVDGIQRSGALDPLSAIKDSAGAPEGSVLVLKDFHPYLAIPEIWVKIKAVAEAFSGDRKTLIFLSCRLIIPPELEKELTVVEFQLPDREHLDKVLMALVDKESIEEDDRINIVEAALGLTEVEAENTFALARIKSKAFNKDAVRRVQEEKASTIKKSGLLEWWPTIETPKYLGGMDLLKEYLIQSRVAFTPEAREFGIDGLKGVLLVGVAGCLAGDTRISINRHQHGSRIRFETLEGLYYRFNGKYTEGVKKGAISQVKGSRPWDLSLPTRTLALKENHGYIGTHEIEAVTFSGVKEVYLVETELGLSVKATKDHKFLAPSGEYIALERLSPGDEVITHKEGRLLEDNSNGRNKNIALFQINNVGNHPYARRRIVNELEYTSHPLHRLVVEAHMNKMRLESFLYVLHGDVEGLEFLDPDIEVHHIDEDRRNNRRKNLLPCTKAKHSRLHTEVSGPPNRYRFSPRVQKIMSKKYAGKEPTYDITMKEPYHNFVANGFVVHNCGKSLAAKIVAAMWEWPLFYLDIGKIFGSLVGQSEERMRSATHLMETVAPAICLVDEIEKGMAGLHSSGSTDSGVSSRVLSALLVWMGEHTAPVYLVATCNSIQNMPPELVDRFDETFFVDMPSDKERQEIFSIHLEKRKRDPGKFLISELGAASEGHTGRDIERIVKRALIVALQDKREVTTKDILLQIKERVPTVQIKGEEISAMREWAKKHGVRMASSLSIPPATKERKRRMGMDPLNN